MALSACLTLMIGALAGTGSAVGPGHTVVPSSAPTASTPAVQNGQVNAIVQVGSTVVVGGTFTSVNAPGGGTVARSALFAFDASTGALRSSFAPALNGVVEDLLPGPQPGTVYAAGSFTQVSGATQSHVTLLNVSTGQVVPGFNPPATNGRINALTAARGRVLVGGNFTVAGGQPRNGLASLDQQSGGLDSLLSVALTERHNDSGSGAQGAIGVRDMEATSSGDKLVAIGNFKKADGLDRDQVVVIDVAPGGAQVVPDWRTRRYEPYCFNWAFDTYVRGVSIDPDDEWFVVTSTGGHNTGTLCDTAARFELGATGQEIEPTWIDYSGGDTLWSVEVTENAVYVGGHQRWMNNSDASDRNGQGSTPRAGLAALDPDSGLPIAWNPGRNPRGAAAFVLYATPDGLWLGSDTEWIGNYAYRRPRLAFFPQAGGAAPHEESTPALPGDVYLGGSTAVSQGNVLYRVNAGGSTLASVDGGPTWEADDGSRHNGNSNAAGWAPGATIGEDVPSSTPSGVFDTERWSPNDSPRMQWDFPVEAGLPLEVRLFFANRCTCTSSVGSRVFDVDIEGERLIDDLDLVEQAGDQVGTMRSFEITSDGNVDIDFAHVVENPLVNAIEIVRRDLPPPTPPGSTLSTVAFDGTTAAAPEPTDTRDIDWTSVRGAFMVGETLFYGQTDGYLYRRTFDESSAGAATRIDPYNDPAWSDVTTGSGNTFRGALPNFYGELSALTGLTYGDERIYYTLSGSSQLYWRWFNADSGVVGSQRFTASGGIDWSGTAGIMRVDSTLYVVDADSGDLLAVQHGPNGPQGGLSAVDDTIDWSARAMFVGPGSTPPPPNDDPVAAFSVSCTLLTCDVDGSGSSDSDGSVSTWAWDFGDGQGASGSTATHTYDAAGSYVIDLEVTDDQGATSSTSRTVVVDDSGDPPPAGAIEAVGSESVTRHSANPTVTVPGAVQAGDVMVLVGSYGAASADPVDPDGWTLLEERGTGGMEGAVWLRVATAADAGQGVTTSVSGLMKSALLLTAYRGVSTTDPVGAIEASLDAQTSQHTTPEVAAEAGQWVVEAWAAKSSSVTDITPPSGLAVREENIGAGGGAVSGLVGDSDGPVAAGSVGGNTATTDTNSGRSISWTLTLVAGDGSSSSNDDPVAAFSVSCTLLTCDVDGSGSSDSDGSVSTWAWDFGDGQGASGSTATHTYDAAGSYVIDLEVTDDQGATSSTSRTVVVDDSGDPPPAGAIEAVGSESVTRHSANPTVTVPGAVQAGDVMVLVGSYGAASADPVDPDGWTLLEERGTGGMEGAVWLRVATAADAGQGVTTSVSGLMKSALLLTAYRGVSTTDPVGAIEASLDAQTSQHTTPEVAAEAGQWVVEAWAAKSSSVTDITPPSGLAVREENIGAGGGAVSGLVGDSDGPVAAGSVGGNTATTDTNSGRSISWTLTLTEQE